MRLRESWKPATVTHYPTLRSALFVSAEAFRLLAVQAHLAAQRELLPAAGQHWIDECGPCGSAEAFAEALVRQLAERVRRHAIATGHLAEAPWLDDPEAPLPGAGRSPAAEGHGWPAPAPGALPPVSAVGPASGSLPARDITVPANPLFAALGLQELPAGDTPVNTPELEDETHGE